MTSPIAEPAPARPRLVSRRTVTLRPHLAYTKLLGPGHPQKIYEMERLGEPAFAEPLLVTHEGLILDRHQLALRTGRKELPCLEYDLTAAEEALLFLIQHHAARPSSLNAFCRVALALTLEPSLREEVRARRAATARESKPSDLTTAEQGHVRTRIAKLAGVCTGNVTKAKQILQAADPRVLRALADGRVSIHRAHSWRSLPRAEQREALDELSFGKDTKALINALLRKHRPGPGADGKPASVDLAEAIRQIQECPGAYAHERRRGRRRAIVVILPDSGPRRSQP
ncbi:MAG: hypothetical protein M0Z94_02500 [Dehalococcoidales bacterium]|nr:hypothetical protein [Dehalococcoidales bacterium]